MLLIGAAAGAGARFSIEHRWQSAYLGPDSGVGARAAPRIARFVVCVMESQSKVRACGLTDFDGTVGALHRCDRERSTGGERRQAGCTALPRWIGV